MGDSENNNPFTGLFPTINDAARFSSMSAPPVDNDEQPMEGTVQEETGSCTSTGIKDPENCTEQNELETIVRDVFGITLTGKGLDGYNKLLVFVGTDSIEHALCERLMLIDIKSKLVKGSGTNRWTCESHTVEQNVINYLFECFCRLQRYNQKELKEQVDWLTTLTLRNVSTALQVPDHSDTHKVQKQFVSLFAEGAPSPELSTFTAGIIAEMRSDGDEPDDDTITTAFEPVLDIIRDEALSRNLLTFRQYWFEILQTFASIEPLAKLIIRHSETNIRYGKDYSDKLLGALLSMSCLPKGNRNQPDFLVGDEVELNEGNVWTALNALTESLHLVFHSLLKSSPEVRHRTLQWIGDCLKANARRGDLWTIQDYMYQIMLVNDGFMVNLGTVLLRLCQPFCAKLGDPKSLKIDPTYCAAEPKDEEESRKMGQHLQGMSSVTCLIPTPEGETRAHSESFGFVTECFFLTHRALDLGFRVVLDKLLQSNQDVVREERAFNEARNNGAAEIALLQKQLKRSISKYMCLRAGLLAPELLNLLSKFHATTAFWLVQVNLHIDDEDINPNNRRSNYAPNNLVIVKFPLPDRVPTTLRCIPEFVVENTIRFLSFLRHLSRNSFEEQGPDFLNPILTEIIALMESPQRLHNPHLRARLAEGLEALLPSVDEASNSAQPSLGTFYRKMLFVKHPHRYQIVTNLLNVFVSIEMAGQGVQFEQKFNYRRPMYIVMAYLWKLDEHRTNFKNLAEEAEQNMEAVPPPLFLRFINLLMNDAVFLLDEALSNMAQIKQMHQARESGEWKKLPQLEQSQQEQHLRRIGMIARYDNILGRETINILGTMTTEIKSIFCHSTMVDRIASMLNYLLLQLVGPNKRNLKVKDQKEYDFNPANLVLNICEIYINLSHNENFILAVSQDGRSYSPELFKYVDSVLCRIGGVEILDDLNNFAKRVEVAAYMKKEEEEILNNAPDDYLDPIMSTLMTDPVILPSSKITVDRTTIARHLLSDETDPFNRSPLTMDRVKSNTELRDRIEEWIRHKKQEHSKSVQPS